MGAREFWLWFLSIYFGEDASGAGEEAILCDWGIDTLSGMVHIIWMFFK